MSQRVEDLVAEQLERVLAVARVVGPSKTLSIEELQEAAAAALSDQEFQVIDPYEFAIEATAILLDVLHEKKGYTDSRKRVASAMFELFDALEEITDLFPGAAEEEEVYWKSRGVRLDG